MAKPKRPRGEVTERGAAYAVSHSISINQVRGLLDSDIDTLEVVEDNTEQVLAEFPQAIMRALEKVGLVAEGYAKRLCPVDTGRLRNSITHTIDGDEQVAIIGTNVEYALYVHEGTWARLDAGTPFLTDAAQQNADRYRRIIESELRGKM